jgi:hypothetical protein
MTPRRPITVALMSVLLVCGTAFSISRATHDSDRTATEITHQVLDTPADQR